MFDADFYAKTLPDLVRAECLSQPEKTPVVALRLGDGGTLDVCHVAQLSERWLTLVFFRDVETCEDMDVCFVPYELVARVTVSLDHKRARKLGFSVDETVKNTAPAEKES